MHFFSQNPCSLLRCLLKSKGRAISDIPEASFYKTIHMYKYILSRFNYLTYQILLPSTWVRSSLPWWKALLVKSPAWAGSRPLMDPNAAKTALTTACPPWTCSSAESSPVKLLGPKNKISDYIWIQSRHDIISQVLHSLRINDFESRYSLFCQLFKLFLNTGWQL